jgi:hypothetical protein
MQRGQIYRKRVRKWDAWKVSTQRASVRPALSFSLNLISVRVVGFVYMMRYDAFFGIWVSGGKEVDR